LKSLKYFLCCFFPFACIAQPQKVTLTAHNLPHYSEYKNSSHQPLIADETFTGEAVSVVRCVFNALEQPLEIKVLPWKRAQHEVSTGIADGFFAASQSATRDKFAVLSNAIAGQNWTWYYLKNNPLNPDSTNFREKANVGAMLGANMRTWLVDNQYNISMTANTYERLLQALLSKRIDAVLANDRVMDNLTRVHAKTIKSKLLRSKPVGVYFAKKFIEQYPGFIGSFNEKIPQCRE